MLVAVTVALGTTAWLAVFTVPETLPPASARAVSAERLAMKMTSEAKTRDEIVRFTRRKMDDVNDNEVLVKPVCGVPPSRALATRFSPCRTRGPLTYNGLGRQPNGLSISVPTTLREKVSSWGPSKNQPPIIPKITRLRSPSLLRLRRFRCDCVATVATQKKTNAHCFEHFRQSPPTSSRSTRI